MFLLMPYFHRIVLRYLLKGVNHTVQVGCIVEESKRDKALGWIYPLESFDFQGPVEYNTTYLPNIQSVYNCKFSPKEKCVHSWSLNSSWYSDNSSSLLEDSRWDDLRTIILRNTTENITFSKSQKQAFSVRSSGVVTISLCPAMHTMGACHQFKIKKKEIQFYRNSTLENNKQFSRDILAKDEWRHFEIDLSQPGNISLLDKSINGSALLSKNFPNNISEMNLILESDQESAWKISENHFMSTTIHDVLPMGPKIDIPYKDLCISLFVACCSHCQMVFLYKIGENYTILHNTISTQGNWTQIRLEKENVPSSLELFVQTKYVGDANLTGGWWRLDDIRVCHRNDFPQIDNITRDTSIILNWTQLDTDNLTLYALSYQSIDDCKSNNSIRHKSSGFLTSKYNEFNITGLTPKTKYNISIFTLLYINYKELIIETMESDTPSLKNVEIYAMDPHSAYFRYDLPPNTTREPTDIRVRIRELNYSSNCSVQTIKIEKCKLWRTKYCAKAVGLDEDREYEFSLSAKDTGSESFGDEVYKINYTRDRVPASPKNVSYELMLCEKNEDYSKLIITWNYPYHPNGTISTFHISLQNSTMNSTEETKNITSLPTHILKVPIYNGSKYKISLQSANDRYRSDLIFKDVETENIKSHIPNKPKLSRIKENLVFFLPMLDRRVDSYNFTIIFHDFDSSTTVQKNQIPDGLDDNKSCNNYTIASKTHGIINSTTITRKNISDMSHVLRPNKKYCVTYLIKFKYCGILYDVIYHDEYTESSSIGARISLWFLLIPIFLICMFIGAVMLRERYELTLFDDSGEYIIRMNSRNSGELLLSRYSDERQ
ncbi:uncharacterized protein LOC143196266 isoform X3 [Rhynchophorus ferrugineus]|uniref:uncharacterized protein LOC143196266 isoform X3 n=1 Tax=Rhynchophorus ferrugineus TaxID=354439 RepID=UPI003FCE6FDC